jgi:hypothetical protein
VMHKQKPEVAYLAVRVHTARQFARPGEDGPSQFQ